MDQCNFVLPMLAVFLISITILLNRWRGHLGLLKMLVSYFDSIDIKRYRLASPVSTQTIISVTLL